MSYTTKFVGQLVHPNVTEDALKLAKIRMSDLRPWPEGTVFTQGSSVQWWKARTPNDREFVSYTQPFDAKHQEITILVHVNPVSGDVIAAENSEPYEKMWCGQLRKALVYFPETWEESDMMVMAGDSYGRCLWYAEDLKEFLIDRALRLKNFPTAPPFTFSYYDCPVSKNLRAVPLQIQSLLARLCDPGVTKPGDRSLNELGSWLLDEPAVRQKQAIGVPLLDWINSYLQHHNWFNLTPSLQKAIDEEKS